MKFSEYLQAVIQGDALATEDILASILPLIRESLAAHKIGLVAPLEGLDALHVEHSKLWFAESRRQPPRTNLEKLRSFELESRTQVEIVAETRRSSDVSTGIEVVRRQEIAQRGEPLQRPAYLPGYVTWEHELQHHDPATDVFSLGLLLASLACRLDFSDPDDLETFVTNRRNLFAIRPDLHPILASVILKMTELDRQRRPADLAAILATLENYRDQPVDLELDLARVPGFQSRDRQGKQDIVLGKLRERLFDLSKRNALLHFRSTLQNVNLTHASIPLMLDIRNIRESQVLVANDQLRQQIVSGKPLSLNKYLNFTEALYLPSLLDRIIADVRRDQNEFGFAQLRLVLCSLSWANLKERPIERFVSPLVLLPVTLSKVKGVRDVYHLEPQGTEAEINPVIRHQFRRLYNINLPETLDLNEGSLPDLHQYLAQQVQASEPAVSVQLTDRPRVDLIHEKAKRRLDQYRRNARLSGRGVRTYANHDYSYDPANFFPLGLKLFSNHVRAPQSQLRSVIESRPRPRSFMSGHAKDSEPAQESLEQERSMYQVRDIGEENPYLWNFDLCSVTLANFHYRRMSLVRDYEAIQDRGLTSAAFDDTFSVTPKAVGRQLPTVPALADRFDVVPCDPTQATAIAEARAGRSYIIQGPPGTGKSQTITNLIADYVAHGKRVLFVCEKRAAIDVVYARMKQVGLGSLGCLIHDSQADKKEFVLDLKQTYETLVAESERVQKSASGNSRDDLLREMDQQLAPLERFDEVMQVTPESLGLPLRGFLDRLVAIGSQVPEVSVQIEENLPSYSQWYQHRTAIEGLRTSLLDLQPQGIWSKHPLRLLSPAVAHENRPMELISQKIPLAQQAFQQLFSRLKTSGITQDHWPDLERVEKLLQYFQDIAPVAQHGNLRVLDSQSTRAQEFSQTIAQLQQLEARLTQAQAATVHWRKKFSPVDLATAYQQAQQFAGQRFPYFSWAWWRLRSALNQAYDFRAHAVQPTWLQVLQALHLEYETAAEQESVLTRFRQNFAFSGTPGELKILVDNVREKLTHYPTSLTRIHQALLKSDKAESFVNKVLSVAPAAHDLTSALTGVLAGYMDLPLNDLATELGRIMSATNQVPQAVHLLRQLGQLPSTLCDTLRKTPWTIAQTEAALARQSWKSLCQRDRDLTQFNEDFLRRCVTTLESQFDRWLSANSNEIMARVKDRFLDHARSANQSSGASSPEEREFKKHFTQGRRILEHEFGKTMRYKSIRELVDGPSGVVIRDLKPVWLMSPLSVSDTLPLAKDFFDVVIFDEASQVPLEEAVPAIFRGQQVIVVGDEMQLPPTNFFSTKDDADDDSALRFESQGELISFDLQCDSFLSHAAKNLPATMLGWHYRSRNESLISFSNWAFYDGRLLTVPDSRLTAKADSLPGAGPMPARQSAPPASDPTRVNSIRDDFAQDDFSTNHPHANHNADGSQLPSELSGSEQLLANPLSFHYLPHGLYENRRNRVEAEYIARMVRDLLAKSNRLSLAIIAFSEAQQDEIEGALHRLTLEDDEFRQRYEAELQREEDGQFVGLLVKNLENIQGDERDIVILSICYAKDPRGKMLMNFGPINQSGGEKRLNVAFSRAKKFMAVVSSIQYAQITNEYNLGANCLRNYLRYAEATANGDLPTVQRVMHGLSRWHGGRESNTENLDEVGRQLRDELRSLGFLVDENVGQSHFRVDLGVYLPGDQHYRVGVLIDSIEKYENSTALERELLRPRLLRTFGWRVCTVLAKDWIENRSTVLERIREAIDPSDG
ncbi:MAG: DUF4011 domain-containing protein [Planctomycetaceae bacterium]|nr:DUF4011 domain-containing protein [Planctomycetaceae bacterium]